MTKLLRGEIAMVEAVEAMSRRIEALEKDKRELQDLCTSQFARSDAVARDYRRMNWLEDHPDMIDYFEGYWYYGDDEARFDSFREVIDDAMKAGTDVVPDVPAK